MRHERHLHLTLRDDPSATARLRNTVEEASRRAGLDADECFDLKLAATEAVTNALKGTADPHTVEVSCVVEHDAVVVKVFDRGVFAPLRAAVQPGPYAERGRGVALMSALADDVEFQRAETGTRVLLRKHATRRSRPALCLAG